MFSPPNINVPKHSPPEDTDVFLFHSSMPPDAGSESDLFTPELEFFDNNYYVHGPDGMLRPKARQLLILLNWRQLCAIDWDRSRSDLSANRALRRIERVGGWVDRGRDIGGRGGGGGGWGCSGKKNLECECALCVSHQQNVSAGWLLCLPATCKCTCCRTEIEAANPRDSSGARRGVTVRICFRSLSPRILCGFESRLGLESSGFSMWHSLKLVVMGFLRVLRFPPLLHRLMVQPINWKLK